MYGARQSRARGCDSMMGLSWASESLQALGIRDQQETKRRRPPGLQPRRLYYRLSAACAYTDAHPMTRDRRLWNDLRTPEPPGERVKFASENASVTA